jgi:hypothetical protein
MIRDLGHVVDREKAEIGLFVTLTKPTDPMKKEAVKAGYYDSVTAGVSFPKIQILTIEGLLNGTERPLYPDLMLRRSANQESQARDKGKARGIVLILRAWLRHKTGNCQ